MKYNPNKISVVAYFDNLKTQLSTFSSKLQLEDTELNFLYDLMSEGFPPHVLSTFLTVANTRDKEFKEKIIMSRVPGEKAFQLIMEGYFAKGFHIKAKSCDWGPMAGFVCQLPLFNKRGLGENKKAAVDNFKKHLDYLKYLYDRYPGKDPFQQIIISEARKKEIFNVTGGPGAFNVTQVDFRTTPSVVYGVATDTDKTVKTEILAVKAEIGGKDPVSCWKLYHGGTKYRLPNATTWHSYQGVGDAIYTGIRTDFPERDRARIANYHPKDDVTFPSNQRDPDMRVNNAFDDFHPINGILNPEDLSKEKNGLHTVAGDYDLMAIWPLNWENMNEDLFTRESERRWEGRFFKTSRRPFTHKIIRVRKKTQPPKIIKGTNKYSEEKITWNKKLQIWVEFVPDLKEIIQYRLEDPNVGNVSDLTRHIIQVFQGTVDGKAKEVDKEFDHLAQSAVHSDEGGRPDVNDIDLPFAVFHMKDAGKILPKDTTVMRAGLIKTPLEFLQYINYRNEFYTSKMTNNEREKVSHPIILNYGWLLHLFVLSMEDNEIGNFEFEIDDPKKAIKKSKFVEYARNLKKRDKDLKKSFLQGLETLTGIDSDNEFKTYRRCFIQACYSTPSTNRARKVELLLDEAGLLSPVTAT